MRKFLTALGAATLFIVVAVGIGVGFVIHQGNNLDRESQAYVDSAVPAILAIWSKDALRDRAKPEDLRSVFGWASRLGPLEAYEGATGDSNMSFMFGGGSVITARYAAKVRFRNGTATIRVVL